MYEADSIINDHSIITDVDNEESYNKLNNNDKKSN